VFYSLYTESHNRRSAK